MCNGDCLKFGKDSISREDVSGKKLIEVGSMNVNGSIREIVQEYGPLSYVGVDIMHGPGVDEICDVTDLLSRFGSESFDMVICTEVIEHVRNWQTAISNIKQIMKPEALLVLTTRSVGCEYHGHPFDFWRYEASDLSTVFADFLIQNIEADSMAPGVFIAARKPADFCEVDLSAHELYSIISKKRCKDISNIYLFLYQTIYSIKSYPRAFLSKYLPAAFKYKLRKVIQAHAGK